MLGEGNGRAFSRLGDGVGALARAGALAGAGIAGGGGGGVCRDARA